jgi:small conductance mechanosensitive channel
MLRCCCVCFFVMSAAIAVWAQSSSTATVRLEGRRLFDISGSRGITATERAAKLMRRLEALTTRSEPVSPPTVRDATANGGESQILFEGEPVLTVTNTDAQDRLMSRQALAERWSERMAEAISEGRAARRNPLTGAGFVIRNSFAEMVSAVLRWLPRLGGAIILFVLFTLVARFVRWVVDKTVVRTHFDPNLRQLIRALAYYGTWTVGGIAILSTIGMESGSIATTLGVSGFVLGFAFKDILSHVFAGLLLLMGRQFRIGDQILVKDHEGIVERIEIRALYLRTADNRLVIIPNGDVLNSVVLSNTANPTRRRDFTMTVRPENNLTKAYEVAREAVSAVEGVLSEPAPDVIADSVTPTGVVLRVRFHVDSTRPDIPQILSACLQAVLTAFEREKIILLQDPAPAPPAPAVPAPTPPASPAPPAKSEP